MTTTTTSRFRLPAVLLAVVTLVASLLVATGPEAQASHQPTVSISDGYRSQPPPFPSDCPCDEGTGSNTTINFDVSLSSPADETITVDYTTSDGSAVAGQDYVAESGTITFDPGPVTRQTISIEIVADEDVEENEDFFVFLFNLSDTGQMGDQEGVGQIADDDEPPTDVPAISIDDVAGPEDSGSLTFTVSLDQTSSEDIQVRAATSDGSATFVPGNDYQPNQDCLTIAAGDTTETFSVTINDDTDYEPDENFFVDLSRPTGCDGGEANFADDQGEGTIENDDPAPERNVSVEDTAQLEGDSGTTDFEVTFSLDGESDDDVTVEWETRDGTATEADDDYQATSGSVTIPSGETSATDTVTVNGDTKVEDDETFFVQITSQENATVDDGTGEVTIRTDEPSLTISDGFAEEPDEGSSGMSFTVELSQPAEWTVSVDFATEDGTAKAGEDYEETSGTREFPPGETTTDPIVVDVHADDEDEGSEKFFVNLSNSEGAVIEDGRGEGLIGGAVVADAGPNKSGESEAPVSFTGAATDGSGDYSFTWDFGDGTAKQTGVTVKHHFPETGTFEVTLTVKDNANGDTSTDTTTATLTDSGKVNRSSASERIGTAIDVSSDHWNRAGTVLLATAYNYPDALAAGPLSQKLDAPMLLTGTGDEVPDAVTAELDRLDADKVVILGGAQAVPQAQADDLAGSGYQVQRIADVSRFGTAADIAVEVGPTAKNEVTVALGAHADQNQTIWADSLSAGSFAALSDPLPALLTHSDFVPDETLNALEQLNTDKVFVLGGTRAITPAVQSQLEAEGYTVQRVAGQNRFETSVEAGKIAMSRYPAGQVHPVFATGANFPDGLTSGALAGKVTGPVVLVTPDDLNDIPGTRQFLRDEANRFDVGTVVGGEKVVSENVRTQARADIDAS